MKFRLALLCALSTINISAVENTKFSLSKKIAAAFSSEASILENSFIDQDSAKAYIELAATDSGRFEEVAFLFSGYLPKEISNIFYENAVWLQLQKLGQEEMALLSYQDVAFESVEGLYNGKTGFAKQAVEALTVFETRGASFLELLNAVLPYIRTEEIEKKEEL